MLNAFILAATLAPPTLPVLRDATLDEAFAQHWQATVLIVLVGNEQMTQADWERSVWADPELTAFLEKERWPVVYADIEADRAATWFMQVSSTPAAILFTGGSLKDRRFGQSTSDSAEHIIRWLNAPSTGRTLADQLVDQADADPTNFSMRSEAMQELHRAGRDLDVYLQIAWLLEHTDLWVEGAEDQDPTSIRSGLLWWVGSLREATSHWEPADSWSTLTALADAPDITSSDTRTREQRLARTLVQLRRTLEQRRDDTSATDQDLFILNALVSTPAEFQDLLRQAEPIQP
jgi:hypothetical protein